MSKIKTYIQKINCLSSSAICECVGKRMRYCLSCSRSKCRKSLEFIIIFTSETNLSSNDYHYRSSLTSFTYLWCRRILLRRWKRSRKLNFLRCWVKWLRCRRPKHPPYRWHQLRQLNLFNWN